MMLLIANLDSDEGVVYVEWIEYVVNCNWF